MKQARLVTQPVFFAFILLFAMQAKVYAALLPANGAVLNYTQVMFEYDEVPGASEYILSVTSYPFTNDSSRRVTIEFKNKSLAFLVKDQFEFGQRYSWNYKAFKSGSCIFTSKPNYFSIMEIPFTDTSLFRYHVNTAIKGKYADNLLFIDHLGIAIDRKGKPVWYLNRRKEEERAEPGMRNLRMTHDGTVTYMTNEECSEANIAGTKTWQAPNDGTVSGDAKETYHHDFRKLQDGSFVAAGYKFSEEPNYFDPAVKSRVRYNTLIQYSNTGEVLWWWYEKDKVPKKALFVESSAVSKEVAGTHMNGFDYDGRDNTFILSFRNTSSVMKISKETGKVLYDLSDKEIHDGNHAEPWFIRQHGPVVTNSGVLIYNNNARDSIANGKVSYPTVMIIKEPAGGKKAKIIWEYECRSAAFPEGVLGKEGYAIELPNKNILVCMGGANRTFEVTRSKKVVWECFFEKYIAEEKAWKPFNNYRCNFSSSLFPRYFTIQHTTPAMHDPGPNDPAKFKLNNEGTEDDEYIIETISSELLDTAKKVIRLKALSSALINIPLVPKKISLGKKPASIEVKVYPAANKEMMRSITLQLSGND